MFAVVVIGVVVFIVVFVVVVKGGLFLPSRSTQMTSSFDL